jgi:hypothetical protein
MVVREPGCSFAAAASLARRWGATSRCAGARPARSSGAMLRARRPLPAGPPSSATTCPASRSTPTSSRRSPGGSMSRRRGRRHLQRQGPGRLGGTGAVCGPPPSLQAPGRVQSVATAGRSSGRRPERGPEQLLGLLHCESALRGSRHSRSCPRKERAKVAVDLSFGAFDVIDTLRRRGDEQGTNPRDLARSALITSGGDHHSSRPPRASRADRARAGRR